MLSPNLDHNDLDRMVETACRMADAAGAAALAHFRAQDLTADNKDSSGGFDPVTVADRTSEAAMRAILTQERPGDGILGEEEGHEQGETGLTWVLDPIDGTRAFISGLPSWGILIALDDGKEGRLGLVDQPHIGERFLGVPGRGAALLHKGQRREISVLPCPGLAAATLMTTDTNLFEPDELPAFEAIRERAKLTRFGWDCYSYAMVALGQVDLVVESGLAAYDIAAPAALVRAAGGVVTDWQGGDPRWGGRVIAAGDPKVHAEALAILAQVPPT
ncbi:MAG: inositol monophosphatase family protein [Pseudomonadota bacterium]